MIVYFQNVLNPKLLKKKLQKLTVSSPTKNRAVSVVCISLKSQTTTFFYNN